MAVVAEAGVVAGVAGVAGALAGLSTRRLSVSLRRIDTRAISAGSVCKAAPVAKASARLPEKNCVASVSTWPSTSLMAFSSSVLRLPCTETLKRLEP